MVVARDFGIHALSMKMIVGFKRFVRAIIVVALPR